MSKPKAKKASGREVDIRLARPGDEVVVSSLIFEAFSPYRDQYTPDGFEYVAATPETVRERFPEGPIWLAFVGGEAVGTVSGMPDEGRFYIRSMAVKPSAQRGGIGQKLVEVLERFAVSEGFTKLYLYTTFVLPGAKRLYEKNGFYVLRETPPEEWCGMGGLEMEKQISSK
ncbi:MAG: GNAT family N-acetyltransferase [Pyrinomonadaceae bacterium]